MEGTINGYPFQATLEPDGKLGHWLKIDQTLREASGAHSGETAMFAVSSVAHELEPELPPDFHQALVVSPAARTTWDATTTIARIDWVHWIESARQEKTRKRRIDNACDMLAAGKKRVCCFDSSGFYSKSLCAPQAKD